MKIIATGWNYLAHNKEMDRPLLPKEPVIFMKPDSALLRDGKPFFIPDFSDRIEYETEIVVRINKLGKNISEKYAHRYYDAVTVGIDFTARDMQQKFREQGGPWELSKGFDNSAAVGDFIPVTEFENIQNMDFHLKINGKQVQAANTQEMIFSIDYLVAYVSQFCTLKIGDLIFTGTPSGVGKVEIDDHLEGFIGDKKLLSFNIK